MSTPSVERYTSRSSSQDALALIALFCSVAGAAWMVPVSAWGDLVDPAARQGPLIVLLVPVLLALRRGGRMAVIWEKRILSVVLAAMPLVYLESGVLHGAGTWLALEAMGVLIFAAWAWLGYRRDPWVLALGLAAHGIAWDSWHHGSHYIASWYASACLIIDIGLAAYVALQRDRYLRAATLL